MGPPKGISSAMAPNPPQVYAAEGRRLRAARQALGYKEAVAFARELGISKQRLRNWERGIVFCRPEHLRQLYEQFGIGSDFLFNAVFTALPADLIGKVRAELERLESEDDASVG